MASILSNRCRKALCSRDIKNARNFRYWARTGGHPDKGGDTEIFKLVRGCQEDAEAAGMKDNYCKGYDKDVFSFQSLSDALPKAEPAPKPARREPEARRQTYVRRGTMKDGLYQHSNEELDYLVSIGAMSPTQADALRSGQKGSGRLSYNQIQIRNRRMYSMASS